MVSWLSSPLCCRTKCSWGPTGPHDVAAQPWALCRGSPQGNGSTAHSWVSRAGMWANRAGFPGVTAEELEFKSYVLGKKDWNLVLKNVSAGFLSVAQTWTVRKAEKADQSMTSLTVLQLKKYRILCIGSQALLPRNPNRGHGQSSHSAARPRLHSVAEWKKWIYPNGHNLFYF